MLRKIENKNMGDSNLGWLKSKFHFSLSRGHVQYMSAGTGVYHSEHNYRKDILRLLQIWIFPDKQGYKPNCGDYRFNWEDSHNKWLHMVSSRTGETQIKINQDVNIYSLQLQKGKEIDFSVKEDKRI